jgi:FAD/FMN-containing dehydrogenase
MIKYMGHLKKVFDPNGILNPYKVLPDSAFKAGI